MSTWVRSAATAVLCRALTAASIAAIAAARLSARKAEVKPLDSGDETTPATVTTSVLITSETPATATAVPTPAGNPVGPGCAAYEQQVPTGPGAIAGMTQDPVAVATANNPQLTQLNTPCPESSTRG